MTKADILVDLRVAQLLCSRLCHDLVGPAGAVNAGLEILEEASGGDKEASALVADSARQITNRLAFYCVAFGASSKAGETPAQVRKLALGLLDNERVSLDWPNEATKEPALARDGASLILNIILLGIDSLPRGGIVRVHLAEIAEGFGVAVTAAGSGARLKDDIQEALTPSVCTKSLTAHNIHGYLAALLAKTLGGPIEISETQQDEVRFAALVPHAE